MRTNNLHALLFLSLVVLLAGCATQTSYSSCCTYGTHDVSNPCENVLALNGTQRLECSDLSILNLGPNDPRPNCDYFCDASLCSSDPLHNWCPQGCADGADSGIPVCAAIPQSPCISPNCTAMVCGRTSYSPRPSMTVSDYLNAKDAAFQSPQDINPNSYSSSSLEFTSPPEGLYSTSCDFKPLDKQTNREFKASSTMFINTFRFGIGDSFSEFDSGRLYTPISDRFCGFTDYNKYQKDRYINYPELTSQYTDANGYIPWQSMNLWGEGKPDRAVAGSPCNPFTDPDCFLPATCNSNIDSVVSELNGAYSYACNKYLWDAGGHPQNPGASEDGTGCWGRSWNSSAVKKIRWTCSENSKEYSSKGACMQDCYPVRECSIPAGQTPIQFPFLYPDGSYRMAQETLSLSKPDGTQYGTESVSRIDTAQYSSYISKQYEFELQNGYCPETGCVCYTDANGNLQYDANEPAGPDICSTDATSTILNIIPGASVTCQSDGECYSGLCNKNLIPRNVCIQDDPGGPNDGKPVDCGCHLGITGLPECDTEGDFLITARAITKQGSSGICYGSQADAEEVLSRLSAEQICNQPLIPDYTTDFSSPSPCFIATSVRDQHGGRLCQNPSGAFDVDTKWPSPIKLDVSSLSTDPDSAKSFLFADRQIFGQTDAPIKGNLRNKVKLIRECNITDEDLHIQRLSLQALYAIYDERGAFSEYSPSQTLTSLYKITITLNDRNEDGKPSLGDCKLDPERPDQLQVYSWGACEPCSLATSAVQQITPTDSNTPICLTQSDTFGNCSVSQNICTGCSYPSPFPNYNDTNAKGQTIQVSDGQGGLTKSMAQQGPSFLPDPVYLHSEMQRYQKGSTVPILVIPNDMPYVADTEYLSGCIPSSECSLYGQQNCPFRTCTWNGQACATSGYCEGHSYENCPLTCEIGGGTQTDAGLPAQLAKYLRDQGTAILAVHTLSWPDVLMPSAGSYILRDPDAINAIKNKVIYYKGKFPKALTAVILPAIDARQPRLDNQAIPVQDATAYSYALLLGAGADGATVPTDPDGGGPLPQKDYKQVIHGPAPGTLDSDFINSLDLIILKPYLPEMGYYSGGGQAFCSMPPESQAALIASNITNTSRQLLQDFNAPSLLYLGDRATWAGQCNSWGDIDRARLLQEFVRLSANLTYAGVIGVHDPGFHGLSYPPDTPPEEIPLCVVQNASRLTVDLSTETGFYRLSAGDNPCECEKRTKAEQTAGISDICADGYRCDVPEGEGGWPYGYKCPSLCVRKSVCDGTHAGFVNGNPRGNEQAHLCTSDNYDIPLTCTYTDGTVKNPPTIKTMATDDPNTPSDEPDYYMGFLSSVPRELGCCISKIEDKNLDGQIQPDETSYYAYAKSDIQGRGVNPVIYGTKGGEFPECKPGLDITESCVFANFFSNQQLKCEVAPANQQANQLRQFNPNG